MREGSIDTTSIILRFKTILIIIFFFFYSRLQAAAGTKLAEIKEKSALGMQHIIDEHKRLELKIDMMASYIVIPHGGFYRKYEII